MTDLLKELLDDLPPLSQFEQNQPRQRLRSWLSEQLDNETCPGCQWIDKEMRIFKLTWKHYGRPGFDDEKDAKMFREWARHTKRYSPGGPSEVSTWKTRFRNALHKMPDIEELSDHHQLEGSDPYRVYRFRTVEEMEQLREMNPSISISQTPSLPRSPGGVSISYSPSPSSPCCVQPTGMVSTGFEHNQVQSIDQIKVCLETGQPICMNSGVRETYDYGGTCEWEDVMNVLHGTTPQSQNNSIGTVINSPPHVLDVSMYESAYNISAQAIGIKLHLSEKEVHSEIINCTSGVRIAYKPPPPVPTEIVSNTGTKEALINIYGPLSARQIYYPLSRDTKAQKILNWIERGLVVEVEPNGDIYAKRLCQARVFYSDNVATPPKVISRDQRTLVYSFEHTFLPALSLYCMGHCAPSSDLFFSFAQKWNAQDPLRYVYVRCMVTHFLSKKLFQEARATKPCVSTEVSVSNEHDVLKYRFEKLACSEN